MAAPSEGYPEWATNDITESLEGKVWTNKTPPPQEVKDSGLKYQEPMARSWFNYNLNLIRKWIEELDLRTSGGTTNLGWLHYTDTTYTTGSPFVVTAGTTQTVPNNAGSIISSSAPVGASFYDGAKVTADNVGDAYTISVRLNVAASVNEGSFDVFLDIGDLSPIVIMGDSRRMIRGANTFQPVTFDFSVFSLDTFVANGCKIQLEAVDGNISIADINYLIQRTYYKDNT